MATETVLLYNCDGPQWSKLRQMLMMLRVRIRPVSSDQYGLPLGLLVSGKTEGAAAEAITEEFHDSMLVFCNLADQKLEQILLGMRHAGLPPVPLKAVLTATNQEWNSQQLWTELRAEHEAMTAAAQGQPQA